jgi:GT2 family glycosyltransferase
VTEVDVVILTWNDGPLLDVALRSALESRDVQVNAIVVDNASDPPAVVPDDQRVTLVVNDANRGVAPARNQGVRAGSAPIVCFLDSDARLHPDALARLVAAVEADARIGLSAPVFTGQEPAASAGNAPTLARKLARLTNRTSAYASIVDLSQPVWDVDFAIGACQVFRRAAFDAVGGNDESFFYGPEDADFCMRLKNAGWRVVQVRDAAVDHPPRRRFRGLFTRRGMSHAWAVSRFLWRHRSFQSRHA